MSSHNHRKLTVSIRYTHLFAAAFGLFTVGFALLIVYFYFFGEFGGGVFRNSPDGKYHADATNYSRRNLKGDLEERLEIVVTENATGRVIWQIGFSGAAGGKVPEYRASSEKAVRWADDSKSVTFLVNDDREMTFFVP